MGERKAVRAESLDDFRGMLSFTKGGELFPSLELESFSAITATFSDKASLGGILLSSTKGRDTHEIPTHKNMFFS